MPEGSPMGVVAQLDPAGPAADDIATLWWVLLVAGLAVFLVVVTAFVAPMLRRRFRTLSDDAREREEVPRAKATRWIVGLGVAMPTALLVGVLVVTVATMQSISPAASPRGATVIEVVGYQFWWAASYPDHGVTVANELHVPVGERVEVRLLSADVIHSFWVPELHGKLDALPDGTNTLLLEAAEPGVYTGECAEFCGIQHANMGFLVIAEPREAFDAWVRAQQQPAPPPDTDAEQRGQQLFLAEGCASCHTVSGVTETASGVGPNLSHVASRLTLASDTIPNTPDELRRWLRDPDAVKHGTTMPTPTITDEELDAIVAYLSGLE